MKPTWLFYLVLCTALGSGLMAGVFFAFSTFVMPALARLPVPQGIAAMQRINEAVVPSVFLAVFLGTAGTSLVLIAMSCLRLREAGMGFVLGASLLYFLGAFLVTMFYNVPLNDKLAAIDPGSVAGADFWQQYLTRWMMGNHLRTLTSSLALVGFLLALYAGGQTSPPPDH